MRRCVGPRMSQEYVMSQTSLEELLLQNPNAPTNDEYALHFARQLYARREERDGERLVLAFAEETKEFDASDDEQVEWCGESTYGLLDAVLTSTLLSSEARAEINAMMEDAAPSLEQTKTIGHFRFRWTETSNDTRDNTNESNVDATAAVLNDCWDRYVTDFRQPQADLIGASMSSTLKFTIERGFTGKPPPLRTASSSTVKLSLMTTAVDGRYQPTSSFTASSTPTATLVEPLARSGGSKLLVPGHRSTMRPPSMTTSPA